MLLRISESFGIAPEQLLYDKPPERTSTADFASTIDFLQQAQRLGIRSFHPIRDTALFDLIPFVQGMFSGEICITGSSLKGLQEDVNHEFVNQIDRVRDRRDQVGLKVLMTHPKFGYHRESLEGRTRGSIVSEIFQGLKWAMTRLQVRPADIKMVKASPTCFSIFVQDGHRGVGLVNPYPTMKQAFTSLSLIVESVQRADAPGRAQSIYHNYFNSNFSSPWNDTSGKITVTLADALKECGQEKDDELLVREAADLTKLLDDLEKQKVQPVAPRIPESPPTSANRKRLSSGRVQSREVS